MAKIIPFKVEHLEAMDMREHEAALCSDIERLRTIQMGSVACTGIVDGRIVCCGGVMPFLAGNSSIWLIPSIYIQENVMVFMRELNKWLMQVRADLVLNRMETDCIDDELHNRWMESLGFTCEGTKRKYYLGKDYNVWGRIWE